MNSLTKKLINGAVSLIVVGGAGYTISQAGLVDNFQKETGMSKEESEAYVKNIKEEDLSSFDEIGKGLKEGAESLDKTMAEVDCATTEWKQESLSCPEAKEQIKILTAAMLKLGDDYIKMTEDNSGKAEIRRTITSIDNYINAMKQPVVALMLEQDEIDEDIKSSQYNKALLQTALSEN